MIRIGWNKRLSCQLALAAIFGILLAEGAGWRYALCALVLAGFLLAPLLREESYRECAARGAMLLFAGGLAAVSFLAQERQWQKSEQALLTGQEQTIRGTVVRKERKNDRWQMTLALPDGKHQVIVSTEECDYPLDSTLLVKGMVEDFDFPRNEGQFNEKIYYKSRQVIGRMRAEEMACARAPRGIFLWRERLCLLRIRVAQICEDMLPAGEAGILAAMLVGEKSLLDGDVNALFQRAGIGHILAISGMHVSMIGMGIYFLLRKCRLGYSVSGAVTAILLFGYGTMAGMGVSTKRAVCMFFIYLLAQCLGRGYDARAALGVTAFALLLYRPFLLHSVSFQFSFAAAYAVVAIGSLLKEDEEKAGRFLRMLRPVSAALLLQLCILPLTAYYNYELPLCAMFLNLLLLPYAGVVMGFGLAGCGAVLAGGGAAWTGFVSRLLFVPCRMVLSVYIWACRVAEGFPFSSVICGKPSEGKLWVYYGVLAAVFFMLGRRKQRAALAGEVENGKVLRQSKRARGRGEEQSGESVWQDRRAQEHRGKPGMFLSTGVYGRLFLCGALLLAFLCHVPGLDFEVSFLDVGQGDGAFLCTSEGVTCFVDGGSTDVSGVGTYRLLPFLKSKGVRRIDYWLLSHLDEDHVSGFYEVVEAGYPVGRVVLAEGCVRDEAWERLLGTLKQYEVPLILVGAGDIMQLHSLGDGKIVEKYNGGRNVPGILLHSTDENAYGSNGIQKSGWDGARLLFLAPDKAGTSDDRNAASLVCLYEEQGFRALFTGDIGVEQEERLLSGKMEEALSDRMEEPHSGKRVEPLSAGMEELLPGEENVTFPDGNLPKIDLYKAAHHGSNYSNSANFLQAFAPRICVVSCARRNRYGHPGKEAVARMEAAGARVLYTMNCGQIKVTRSGEKFLVKTAEHF